MDKDKKEFVIKKGVLGVGIPIGVLMSITTAFQVPGYLFKIQSFNYKTFLISLAIFLPTFALAGVLWGFLVYPLTRKK